MFEPQASIPRLPDWVRRRGGETPDELAFQSGAALAHLHVVLSLPEVPLGLIRARAAIEAAAFSVSLTGRSERVPELRDALHLTKPGDDPGPAGAIYDAWRRAVQYPVSTAALERAVPERLAAHLGHWLDAGQGGPVDRAAGVLEAVLADHPKEEAAALVLADAALARAVGWSHLVPVLATGLNARDMGVRDEPLRLACHRAVHRSAVAMVGSVRDLTARVAKLREVAPKLRAKQADAVVEMFLTRDAMTPSELSGVMSDRAARRICDRLVSLGAVRELTGREAFRIYGV